jgi:hypothetical protein
VASNDDELAFPGAVKTRTGAAPSGFIVHHTAGRGDAAGVVNWWKKQGRGFGSQYIMDRNGVIHDVAKEFGYTGSNQILNGQGVGKGLNNGNVVGMEIIAKNDKDVTPQQAQNFANFYQNRFPGVPTYGHGQVNPGAREPSEGMTAIAALKALQAGGTATAYAPTPATSPAVAAIAAQATPAAGLRINALNAPVAGALAKQEVGPESAGGAPRAAGEGPLDTRQMLYNKLVARGLAPYQALGALYGVGGETSTFDTGSTNPNDPHGGSFGLANWNGIRRTRLEQAADAAGVSRTDPNFQTDFLVNSIFDKNHVDYQPGVLKALQAAKDTGGATNAFTGKFERPKVNNWQQRYARGQASVGTLDANNQFVLGSAPSSNTTAAAQPSVGPSNASAAPGTDAAANAQAAADQPWWSKIVQGPIDPATGQVDPKAKTPLQQALGAVTKATDKGDQTPQEIQKAAGPDQTALTGAPAPLSRNTSPLGGALLPSASQMYPQRLASYARPLTYNAQAPQAPQMPAAGLQGNLQSIYQGMGLQVPGMTINSLPPLPMTPDDMMYGGGYAG